MSDVLIIENQETNIRSPVKLKQINWNSYKRQHGSQLRTANYKTQNKNNVRNFCLERNYRICDMKL